MIRKKKGNLEWLEFDLLAEEGGIKHGVFLRHGGVSQGSYASLNLCSGIGDAEENVEENQKRVIEALELERLIAGWHIQGTHIEHVTEPKKIFMDCDGLITSHKNWGLLVLHADCQATILFDPIKDVVANIHAGWRGQFQHIYRKTVEKMRRIYGTRPADVLACISPSLGPQNAEFVHYQKEVPEEFWDFQVKPTYFDLWAIAHHQLQEIGILPHHIQIAKMDTYENSSDFYSYRREKKAGRTLNITGDHGTVVALKN